ncbi:MAG: hypothetical protein KBD65_03130 [Candidatus Moranbacteria bacterium]|jgi:hypothetical protein|nr:hypothetical protein [Candidatus Moranbacteria bacterium]
MRTILYTLALALTLGTASAADIKSADAVFGPSTGTCFDSTERIGHDLAHYKAHVLAIQERLGGGMEGASLFSTISFAAPQDIGNVREMLKWYEIKPRLILSHSKGANGKTATLAVRVSKSAIENALQAADPSRQEELAFQGIVSIVGLVPSRHIVSLQQDPRVYLVDITGDPEVTDSTACDGYVQHVTWQLYGLTQ